MTDLPATDLPATDLPGLDLAAFQAWLAAERPDLLTGEPLRARLIEGGLSNLSYAITGGVTDWVLRRPPLGHVQSTAHDMRREHRVISALGPSSVPVPRARLFHADETGEAGVGTPFFLMDLVAGTALSDRSDNSAFSRDNLHSLGPELGAVLGRLHDVDWRTVGLEDFGRPNGFVTRQVARWRTQLDGSRSRDLGALDDLGDRLAASIPESDRASIVHGDYRLDNTLIRAAAPADPEITAVLDWEMSTLGDPMTDLGLFGVYWDLHSLDGASESPLASAIDPSAGYADFAEVVDRYAHERGIAVPDLGWYLAFACFKLGVILEGIHFRFSRGHTVGPGFDRVGQLVTPLAVRGNSHLTARKD